MKLVMQGGQDAQAGKFYPDFRGELHILIGGQPPKHDASTGRVWVKAAQDAPMREYFPGVMGMKWVQS